MVSRLVRKVTGGSGDVLAPATNTDNYLPQWNGANSKTLKDGIPTSTFAPALGADDNYVTDAEKVVIGNTSGVNTGNQDLSALMPKSGGTFTNDITMGAGKSVASNNAANNATVFMFNNGASGLSQVYISDFAGGTLPFFLDGLITTNAVSVKAGTSAGQIARVGGTIFSYIVDAGNSGTSETDLYTDSVPANTLATNKDKLEARYAGIFVSSGTATRQLKCYFGGTAIFDSGALSISLSADWDMEVLIIRVSSTVVRYTVKLNTTGASASVYANVGELTGLTLSNANTLKITGQAGGVGAATNDILAQLGTVKWEASP